MPFSMEFKDEEDVDVEGIASVVSVLMAISLVEIRVTEGTFVELVFEFFN